MTDPDRGTRNKPRPRTATKKPDLGTRARVVTPNGAISVGAKSAAPIDPPRPRKRHTYQLIDPSDRRRLSSTAGILPATFAGFIDQVELAVFEWQAARVSKNVYHDDQVRKILASLAGSLRQLDAHFQFPAVGMPKDKVAELMPQHLRVEQALQPILELIWSGWTDRPRPDFRRALEAIKATSGIGVMGPKHQSDLHAVAAAERLALAWRKYSRLPLSGGSDENTPQGYLTALLSEIKIYEPYGLVPGNPKRMRDAVLAAFQEQVVTRELPLTIDRMRDRAG